MAFLRTQLFSRVLKQHTSLSIALPDTVPAPWPVLYLLHGGTEDSTIWFREARVMPLAERFGLLVVSIDAMSSSYADMRHGHPYFTYLTQEVPAIIAARLPVLTEREDTFVGGFSMGGNGALKAAFAYPERYGACIAMSGARDMIPLFEQWAGMENGPDLRGVEDALGPIAELRGSDNDIVALAERAVQSGKNLPRFFLSCGNEDYAGHLSQAYHEYLGSIGLSHDYFTAHGTHCYAFGELALTHAVTAIWKERERR